MSSMLSGLRAYARSWGLGRLLLRIRRLPGQVARRTVGPISGHLFLLRMRMRRRRVIASYVANRQDRKLHLGAGVNILPGWLNSDGFDPTAFNVSFKKFRGDILLDVRERFPFDDSSLDYIFHEHLIEHLDYHQGQFLLRSRQGS